MNLYCDNYSTCRSRVYDQGGTRTEVVARARGWHLWEGETLGGEQQKVVLCKGCMGAKTRDLPPAPEKLTGQQKLF